MLTTEEANKQIAEKLAQINQLYKEAAAIADKADIYFSTGGPQYGMGGSYEPKSKRKPGQGGYGEHDEITGWMASSQSC